VSLLRLTSMFLLSSLTLDRPPSYLLISSKRSELYWAHKQYWLERVRIFFSACSLTSDMFFAIILWLHVQASNGKTNHCRSSIADLKQNWGRDNKGEKKLAFSFQNICRYCLMLVLYFTKSKYSLLIQYKYVTLWCCLSAFCSFIRKKICLLFTTIS
jgi:hypothetical protein